MVASPAVPWLSEEAELGEPVEVDSNELRQKAAVYRQAAEQMEEEADRAASLSAAAQRDAISSISKEQLDEVTVLQFPTMYDTQTSEPATIRQMQGDMEGLVTRQMSRGQTSESGPLKEDLGVATKLEMIGKNALVQQIESKLASTNMQLTPGTVVLKEEMRVGNAPFCLGTKPNFCPVHLDLKPKFWQNSGSPRPLLVSAMEICTAI